MDYLANGKSSNDLSTLSSLNGFKAGGQSLSKKSKRKLTREKCLDIYNNIQLIDHLSTDNRPLSPPSLTPTDCQPNVKGNTECDYIGDSGSSLGDSGIGHFKGLEDSITKTKGLLIKKSTPAIDSEESLFSSPTNRQTPQPLSRTSTLPANYILSRSFSVSSPFTDITPRRRRKLSIFSRRNSDLASLSTSSLQSMSINDVKVPSPARFTSMYHAVRKGISEHISVNTAELNVLEIKQKQPGGINAAQSYGADKQIKSLERMIKKLQYHQTQLDELHEAYVLQQRYREGAYKLKTALSSSRVSSKASLNEIKHDLTRCSETLCTIEQEFTALMGRFHFQLKGLMGFARLRAGDHFEVQVRYGAQKWKIRGSVKSSGDQSWDKAEQSMQPLLTDLVDVKVMEVKMLGKHVTIGTVSAETKDLFKVEAQDLLMDVNETGTIKLSMAVSWSPFDGYESPSSAAHAHISASIMTSLSPTSGSMRFRSKSVADRSTPHQSKSRGRLATAFSRPKASLQSRPKNSGFNVNTNNNNLKEYLELEEPPPPACSPSQPAKAPARDGSPRRRSSALGVEAAFLQAIQEPTESAAAEIDSRTSRNDTDEIKEAGAETLELEPTADNLPPQKTLSDLEKRTRRHLMAKATELKLAMDDYRGRYPDLRQMEDVLEALMDRLELSRNNPLTSDGFSLSDDVTSEVEDPEIPVFSSSECSELESKFTSSGKQICDEALTPHLSIMQMLLKDVGVFGPLRVKELLALDKLKKQAKIVRRVLDIATQDKEPVLDDLDEFVGKRGLLEMWRSCCDGRTSFCVRGRTLRLELFSEYSRQVREKHPDVADKVFPELVRRVTWTPTSSGPCDVENDDVTLFQVNLFVCDSLESEAGNDLGKIVDKVAHEMFITSTLTCGVRDLILVAIKRMSSLLALRLSNLRALSHLLLDTDAGIRTAAAAHIKHISTDKTLREKAVVYYAELLESPSKRDRQCSCIAVGFMSANECIPQLAYLYHGDPESEVREAASNVLISLGDEGVVARDEAAATWQAQTMTQQVTSRNRPRMGTAL